MAERMNNFNGKEWLQHSFTIWREIKKTQEENKLKRDKIVGKTINILCIIVSNILMIVSLIIIIH